MLTPLNLNSDFFKTVRKIAKKTGIGTGVGLAVKETWNQIRRQPDRQFVKMQKRANREIKAYNQKTQVRRDVATGFTTAQEGNKVIKAIDQSAMTVEQYNKLKKSGKQFPISFSTDLTDKNSLEFVSLSSVSLSSPRYNYTIEENISTPAFLDSPLLNEDSFSSFLFFILLGIALNSFFEKFLNFLKRKFPFIDNLFINEQDKILQNQNYILQNKQDEIIRNQNYILQQINYILQLLENKV